MNTDNVKLISLTQGRYAIVDEADFEMLSKYKWQYAGQGGYAVRAKMHGARQMHKLLANCPKGGHVDHINGDGLDNRKHNLRIASKAENGMNRGKQSDNTSGYKGVVWNKRLNKWIAQIGARSISKTLHIGCFTCIEAAARAYDEAAKKYHGAFAHLNFPEKK